MVTLPYYNKSIIALVFLILLALLSCPVFASVQEASTNPLSTVCGNGVVESGEQCDAGGSNGPCPAVCSTSCTTNSCGGGGGSVQVDAPALETKVIIKGKAYPGSKIKILKDGKSISIIESDSKADFKHEISKITPGVYNFGILAEDKNKTKSIIYNLTFLVPTNTIITVSGIFLPPTIAFDKTTVKKGETINIFGQSVPKAEIDVRILSSEIIRKTTSDEIGAWLLRFDTQSLENGYHTAAAQSWLNSNEKSGFGKALAFNVGETIISIVKGEESSDFNSDGKINLVDFSIFLAWFGKENSTYDLNNNGKVDLVDFSILLSYWTG